MTKNENNELSYFIFLLKKKNKRDLFSMKTRKNIVEFTISFNLQLVYIYNEVYLTKFKSFIRFYKVLKSSSQIMKQTKQKSNFKS